MSQATLTDVMIKNWNSLSEKSRRWAIKTGRIEFSDIIEDRLPARISVDMCDVLIEDDTKIYLLPGFVVDDGQSVSEILYEYANNRHEAAKRYVEEGDWGLGEGFEDADDGFVHVYTSRCAISIDPDDLTVREFRYGRQRHVVAVEPEPPEESDSPECSSGDEHDWRRPYELLGGCESNPGVDAHDGGVRTTEVCACCGIYRITDTAALVKETGERAEKVWYEPADERSLAYIASLEDDCLEKGMDEDEDDPMGNDLLSIKKGISNGI
jgi:hypothetical protein